LKFLYDHVALGADFQARVKWEKGTVVVWDNRVTTHSKSASLLNASFMADKSPAAILDWQDGSRRHLARLTPRAERPYETPFEEK
jgi:sulfonate dioxygenase